MEFYKDTTLYLLLKQVLRVCLLINSLKYFYIKSKLIIKNNNLFVTALEFIKNIQFVLKRNLKHM